MNKLLCLIILTLSPTVWGQLSPAQAQQQYDQRQQKISDVTTACVRAAKKDKICEAFIGFQQLGFDAVEIIKEYIELGPFEYATLTAINYALTGRIRIRSKSYWSEKWRHVYDYQPAITMFYMEREF